MEPHVCSMPPGSEDPGLQEVDIPDGCRLDDLSLWSRLHQSSEMNNPEKLQHLVKGSASQRTQKQILLQTCSCRSTSSNQENRLVEPCSTSSDRTAALPVDLTHQEELKLLRDAEEMGETWRMELIHLERGKQIRRLEGGGRRSGLCSERTVIL